MVGESPAICSGRKWVLCPRYQSVLVLKLSMKPRTIAKDHAKMLLILRVSLSTVNVLYRLKDHTEKKPLPPNYYKWPDYILQMLIGTGSLHLRGTSFEVIKIKPLGHTDHQHIWKKRGETCKPENSIPTMDYGMDKSGRYGHKSILQFNLKHYDMYCCITLFFLYICQNDCL